MVHVCIYVYVCVGTLSAAPHACIGIRETPSAVVGAAGSDGDGFMGVLSLAGLDLI